MSKLEGGTATAPTTAGKKHPLTGNLPRKSSFQSEGLSQSVFVQFLSVFSLLESDMKV